MIGSTERLHLREMTPDDAEFAYHLNKDPEVIQFNGAVPFASVEAAREFLTNYPDYRKNGFGRWAVIEKCSGALIGWCGLKELNDGSIDLGYCFLKQYWGKGYATEAATECLRLGFDLFNFDRILARTDKRNLASIRVLEKLGMQYWKTDVCEHDPEARYYRISRSEWINGDHR